MNHTHKKILNKKLPSYAGFFVLLAALGVTLLLSGNAFIFISRATVGSDPKNVQISNLTDTSFTISYTTDAISVGTISYGADPTTHNIALDDRDQAASGSAQYQIHFITVKNLAPSTKYYYVIDSGSQKLDNNGAPFQITTYATLPNSSANQPTLSGTVTQSDGSIPTEGIVSISTADSQQLSALISPDGSYQIPLSELRSSTGTAAATLTPDTILQLQAMTPTQQSSVKLLESQASQVPKIVLSQDYDFTISSTQQASGSAQTASGSASFPVLDTPTPVSSPEITTPTQAEAFSDQQPLFQGRALADTEVDITIQSQQEISAKLQSDGSGSWEFRPPINLAPGKHTVTIKSLDASGVLQTISRSFTVYAAGSQFVEPSISPVASVSAVPTLAPLPTSAPTPTLVPSPTATPSAAPTLKPIVSKTPLPKTGSSILVYGIIGALSSISVGALLFFIL
jgi:Big-like domain-containing protein/purple acid phosphatase-like protein